MKTSVDAVREAADDQQMLVGIVLSRIAENQTRTTAAKELTDICINEAGKMGGVAQDLNDIAKRFVV